jgi:hypothetical protein
MEAANRIMCQDQNVKRVSNLRRIGIRLAILGLLLVAIVILSPRIFDWITRERWSVTRDLLVEGKKVRVSTEYSETRLFGDPRSFSNWRWQLAL